jgi:hypothetical protein
MLEAAEVMDILQLEQGVLAVPAAAAMALEVIQKLLQEKSIKAVEAAGQKVIQELTLLLRVVLVL